MELRHITADLVLLVMEVGVFVVGNQGLVMLSSIIVGYAEIGYIDARIRARDIEFWVVAELAAEVEFEPGETLLVETQLEQ